ncbi:hypothetical protein [Aquincola tertiaricarbonis]|uniref:hypothetical protein n=1 Tax=Aquincola tertiaricarbonis TaxID=391953 RepID=UPI0006153D6D|nr:hypothetical protein [Aquincola tertiaricarbonis]
MQSQISTSFRFHSSPPLKAAVSLVGLTLVFPCLAVDGCLVLLCLAAPSWQAIPQCVPPVRQLFRDLALGRPFPTCAMAGAGNSAAHQWASAPDFCPPQYVSSFDTENSTQYDCAFEGAVSVSIRGEPFVRTWWRRDGEAVSEFSPAAQAQLGSWNRRFEDDYAAWVAAQPPVVPDPTAP